MTALERYRTLSRPELVEGWRNRRQLIVRAITPIALLATLTAVFALTNETTRLADDVYEVAVEGDIVGAEVTLDALTEPPVLAGTTAPTLEFTPAADAALAVSRGADAGLVVPDDLDRLLADGGTASVGIFTDADERPSRAAASLLRAALFAHLTPLPDDVTIDVANVTPGDEGVDATGGAREGLARVVAAYLLLQGAVLVGTAAVRLTGRRATGNLVPQLLLPVSRFDLISSRAVSELGLGMLSGAPMLVLMGLAIAAVVLADGAVATAVLSLTLLPVVAAAIGVPLICAGLVIGIRAKSAQQVSGLTAGSLVVVALAARLVARAAASTRYLAAIPLVGPAHVLRQAIEGAFDPLALVAALVSTGVFAWLILRLAGALMSREHVALRGT